MSKNEGRKEIDAGNAGRSHQGNGDADGGYWERCGIRGTRLQQRDGTESGTGTRVDVASRSGLFRKESVAADPEFCERFEILPVPASNCVFLSTFNAETILSPPSMA